MANYIQGRLGIYAWMISKIPSWPLLASVTSNFTIHIFTWLFVLKHQKLQNPNCFFSLIWWLFLIYFYILYYFPTKYCAILTIFCTFYGTFHTFMENVKNWKVSNMEQNCSECHHIWWVGSKLLRSIEKVVNSDRRRPFHYCFSQFLVFLTAFRKGDIWGLMRSTDANWG